MARRASGTPRPAGGHAGFAGPPPPALFPASPSQPTRFASPSPWPSTPPPLPPPRPHTPRAHASPPVNQQPAQHTHRAACATLPPPERAAEELPPPSPPHPNAPVGRAHL